MSYGRVVCIAFSLAYFSLAEATITLNFGNIPQPEEENVVLTVSDTGTTVTGTTDQTGLDLNFTSTQTLVVSSTSTIVADNDEALTNFAIALDTGAFTDFIFNASINITSCGGCGGFATLTVDQVAEPSVTFTSLSISNGTNFFTVVASGGEAITAITFDAPDGFSALSQPRLSGPYLGVTTSVPEPASLALLCVGLAGAAFARRRRTQ